MRYFIWIFRGFIFSIDTFKEIHSLIVNKDKLPMLFKYQDAGLGALFNNIFKKHLSLFINKELVHIIFLNIFNSVNICNSKE